MVRNKNTDTNPLSPRKRMVINKFAYMGLNRLDEVGIVDLKTLKDTMRYDFKGGSFEVRRMNTLNTGCDLKQWFAIIQTCNDGETFLTLVYDEQYEMTTATLMEMIKEAL